MPWTVTRYDDRYAPWSVLKRPSAGLPNSPEEQPIAGDFANDEADEDEAGGSNLTLCRDRGEPVERTVAPE